MQPTPWKGQHRGEHGHQPQPLPALGKPWRPELSAPRHGHISSATEQTPSARSGACFQPIKAHILMSNVSRKAAPCKLHHPRKLCCSHASLWGIILLLPPFSRAGGNLHCLLSALYRCQTWLTMQEQRQLFCWAGIFCLPSRAAGMFLLSFPPVHRQHPNQSLLLARACPSLHWSPSFEICLLFTGIKAPTSFLGDGPSLTQWTNPLQCFPDWMSSQQQSPKGKWEAWDG